MERKYNFSAGPSQLPVSVLQRAQDELCCYQNSGSSVMEMSHRSCAYKEIIGNAEALLRELMKIPDDYAVLFLQGGATQQFSLVPMNLACRGQKAAYAVTGTFARKAFAEGRRWCDAVAVTDGAEDGFRSIPEIDGKLIPEDAAFLHITGNNTTIGTMYEDIPKGLPVPLVADWSSGILGKEIKVTDYGLIYAGAQKNMGIAGLTVVIVKRDLLRDDVDDIVPSVMRYDKMDRAGSMLNTPPAFAIYMSGLVFEWVRSQGGVSEMERRNREKAKVLYDLIDASDVFKGYVDRKDRSIMNVTFTLPDEEMTKEFLAMAEGRDMISLKGYRDVGGVRASIYNGMPMDGVLTLAKCMEDFEKGLRK